MAGVTLYESTVGNPGTMGAVERYHGPLRFTYKNNKDVYRKRYDGC